MSLHLNLWTNHALATIVSGLREVRVGNVVAVAEGAAAIAPASAEIDDNSGRHMVPHIAAAIHCCPHCVRLRIDGQANRVAQAFGKDLLSGAIGVVFGDSSPPWIFLDADIAARPRRNIHFSAMKHDSPGGASSRAGEIR